MRTPLSGQMDTVYRTLPSQIRKSQENTKLRHVETAGIMALRVQASLSVRPAVLEIR
jgi:hypothetical protein